MKAPLFDQHGTEVGAVELPPRLFEVRWEDTLVNETVLAFRHSRRSSSAHARGRGEVRGGGKKPWRQKGTGRARHGSIRSPIWIGGGVTHGPNNEKVYVKKINKKVRRKALAMVLSQKIRDGEIFFLDSIALEQAKTKFASGVLRQFGLGRSLKPFGSKGASTLILLEGPQENITRAFRNLPFVTVDEARNANVERTLLPKYILITKGAIEKIQV